MLGISWNSKINRWLVINKEYEINTKNSDLETACQKIITKIAGIKNSEKILKIYARQKIVYRNKNILLYNSFYKPLFDIQHIIKLLGVTGNCVYKKYNEFKNKITHYGFIKNKFGGYIIKEFISESTMY